MKTCRIYELNSHYLYYFIKTTDFAVEVFVVILQMVFKMGGKFDVTSRNSL